MPTERGFSLVETLIAVGVVATVALGAVGATMASRAMAVSTAATRFDALLDAATTTAREIDHGATIAFTPDAYGDGFIARLYRNRPGTAPLETTTLPAVEARVSVTETTSIGAPAFALTVHSNGVISGIPGYTVGSAAGSETPCPPSGAYHLAFAYAGAHADRTLPCTIPSATTGTVAFLPPPSATIAPSPTAFPCPGGCLPTPPPSPNPQPTCPPHYISTNPSTCIRAQLTVTPASLTFTAPGSPASQTFTAQENGYAGPFAVSDTCTGAISYKSATATGPTASYSVSALRSSVCNIVVSDNSGASGTVQVTVESALQKRYVCDPRSPPRSYDTDLGPDPDGVHEDYSDGTTCGPGSTPQPTTSPGTNHVTNTVSPVCTQMFEDDWQCSWSDSASVGFRDPSGTSITVIASIVAASNAAVTTVSLQYWNGNGYSSVSIPGVWDQATSTYSVNASIITPASSSTTYFIEADVICSDQGYPQPQGTACVSGQNVYTVSISPTEP